MGEKLLYFKYIIKLLVIISIIIVDITEYIC